MCRYPVFSSHHLLKVLVFFLVCIFDIFFKNWVSLIPSTQTSEFSVLFYWCTCLFFLCQQHCILMLWLFNGTWNQVLVSESLVIVFVISFEVWFQKVSVILYTSFSFSCLFTFPWKKFKERPIVSIKGVYLCSLKYSTKWVYWWMNT